MAGEWTSQLPEDLRTNEAFTGHATLGDFAKSHLEAQGKLKEFDGKVKEYDGKITDLTTRLTNSLPKLTEKSTDAERANFYKALGRPDKPEDYEFPQIEGRENDPGMVKWAQTTFHKHALSKEQAKGIGAEWNAFVNGMVEAEDRLVEEDRKAKEEEFKKEFKSEDEYKAGVELTRRFWKKLTGTDFDEAYKEAEAWQVPLFMRVLFHIAKVTGEDVSPMGKGRGESKVEGMIYDKSPAPPPR